MKVTGDFVILTCPKHDKNNRF